MNSTAIYDDAHLERTLHTAFEDPEVYKLPKGIIRHDYEHTHAWRVSIARDTAKFVEYFYDGDSGSVEFGLRRAILYRHEVLSAFPVTLTVTFKRALSADPEKRIRRVIEPGRLNSYVHWKATWHDSNHRLKTASFSVPKYGEEEARRMALDATTRNHNPIPKQYRIPDAHATERWRTISREKVARDAVTNEYSTRSTGVDPGVAESFPFGYEGSRRAKLHMAIERDRTLRNKKVAGFLALHGKLFCELCSFNFRAVYSFLSHDIIEVHHKVPLAELTSATKVHLHDLMLLCSNCHTAIHQGDAQANLATASATFGSAA